MGGRVALHAFGTSRAPALVLHCTVKKHNAELGKQWYCKHACLALQVHYMRLHALLRNCTSPYKL